MTEVGHRNAQRLPARRLRRQWRTGLSNLYRFVKGTGGLESAFEAMFALAGPTVEREFDRFARDPVGEKLLAERPRRDLNRLLADREALAAMPKGSFADAYLVYMGGQGMGSADYFLVAAGLEEKAARFGWSDDQLWFVRRMSNSHDLFHVVSGYDRDIIGEIGVDSFTAGQIPLLPLRLLLLYFFFLKPSSPFGWTRFVLRAFRHGQQTPSLACVDYEALFALPLDEARRRIGVMSLTAAHPGGFPARGKLLRRLERNLVGG
jgi:ubiquinone biosynthesis protein COQ4